MSFSYSRSVRLSDTDAAGVIYFANLISICHEAYEEALAIAGVDFQDFFNNPTRAIPIVHARIDFFRPIYCGDKLSIDLTPVRISDNEFEVAYQIFSGLTRAECLAKAITRHVCIDLKERRRKELPGAILNWLTLP